jgi:predicted AAA+ superfamily ATPase
LLQFFQKNVPKKGEGQKIVLRLPNYFIIFLDEQSIDEKTESYLTLNEILEFGGESLSEHFSIISSGYSMKYILSSVFMKNLQVPCFYSFLRT